MKPNKSLTFSLLAASLLSGCATQHPSTEVSLAVIESLHRSAIPELPWRLDTACQPGGLGGAALRATSIEHVVRQNDQRPSNRSPISTANEDAEEVSTNASKNYTGDEIEIAWRKYCHHQLEMSGLDHGIVRDTQVPKSVLQNGCHPQSLYK